MQRLSPKVRVFRFGPFELDIATPELRRAGMPVQIAPQPLRVLSLLASRGGEAVSREQIRHEIWGDDIHVDFELGLNYCLNRIRNALGENACAPRYIETLPRRGYRFIAPLECVGAPAPTLAVLPFENLNRAPEQDFLADAVADALTTELGNISTLRVISRQSVLHLKGTRQMIAEIARELKADVVVEGSVLEADGHLRITAQLVQVEPEQHLWARAYECDLKDLLSHQGQIACAIAEAIEVVLTPAEVERFSRPREVDPEAHLCFLKGRHHMGQATRDGYEKALNYFRAAIERDSSYAAAHAELAGCYSMLGHWGHLPFRDAFREAKEAARNALRLDPALSTAHWAYAWMSWVHDWDLATCEAEDLTAIQLNASDVNARVLRALFLTVIRDRGADAIREAKLALDLDPLSQHVNQILAWVYLFADEYDLAVDQALKTRELFPESPLAYYVAGLAETCRHRYDAALAALEKGVAISPAAISLAYLAWAHAKAGNTVAARSKMRELQRRAQQEYVAPRCQALIYAGLDERDGAFEWLEKAYESRDSGLFWLRSMPVYDSLQGDARFQQMMERMGLVPTTAGAGR